MEVISSIYPKYNNSLDFYKRIYEIVTKKNGRYSYFKTADLMVLVEELSNILNYMINNNIYEIDEILSSSLEYILSCCAVEQNNKSGGRSESNSKKRIEEINKLISLKNEFKFNVKENNSTDDIINSTYMLRLAEFMKLYNGKSYVISKYKKEDDVIDDLDSLGYLSNPLRIAYMCFVLETIKINIEKQNITEDSKYLLNRIEFYIGTNKNIGLPVIDRVSFSEIEMMIKISEYERQYVKNN